MSGSQERSAASRKAVEAGAAVLMLLLGGLVIYDSVRVGIRWADDGPQAGYFPFYVGVLLCVSSVWNLLRSMADPGMAQRSFVKVASLRLILSMLVPTVVYVALIGWMGFYLASILFIGFFMIWLGRYSWLKSSIVALSVNVVTFLLFEIWFKVPLPKGPIESLLGLA